MDCFPVQFGCHFGGLADIPAVHQPEPGGDGGGEVDAIVDEGQGGRASHILPLSPGRAT